MAEINLMFMRGIHYYYYYHHYYCHNHLYNYHYHFRHGTHVCGTIAGAIENEDIQSGNAIYDGVAPGAKLIFIDLSGSSGGITAPGNPAELYDPVINAGLHCFILI